LASTDFCAFQTNGPGVLGDPEIFTVGFLPQHVDFRFIQRLVQTCTHIVVNSFVEHCTVLSYIANKIDYGAIVDVVDVSAPNRNTPTLGFLKFEHQVQNCGLAAPTLTAEGVELVFLDGEVDAVEYIAVFVVAEYNVLEFNVVYFSDLNISIVYNFPIGGINDVKYFPDATHRSFDVSQESCCIYCLEQSHQEAEHCHEHTLKFI